MGAFRHRPGGPAGAPPGGAAAKRPLAERAEGRHFAVVAGFVLWVLLAWVAGAWAQPPLRIAFLDVGQGDAVLIESPSGQAVLYDGGPASEAAVRYLEQRGVDTLDLVVASHNHADHIGGLAAVVRRYRPRFYLDNGIAATTLTYRRVLEAVDAAGSQLLEPTSRRISLGEAVLHVLPPPGQPGWDQNDNSVGLLVEYGTFRLLLAGDAEGRQWEWWLRQPAALLQPVHVHKASHHGSRNGDTARALSRLRPEVVVIGVGGNSYGHPHAEALALYQSQGATVYRTDQHGTVVVEAQRSGQYRIAVERGQGARPPPTATTPPLTPTSAVTPDPPRAEPRIAEATDDEIRELMIAESLASYSGTCPCPYFSDRAGRRCGGRSAYSRPGGASPLCYKTDITDEAVAAYRARQRR